MEKNYGREIIRVSRTNHGYVYSHVRAGTPAYRLPAKLSGLKIAEAGFEKISLNPKRLGVEWAEITIYTK